MTNENARLCEEGIYCWDRDEPGRTIVGALKGRLVLTDHSLIFLSSGKSDVGYRLIGGSSTELVGRSTSGLDESDLQNEGSFKVPLARCTITAEKKGWFAKYLRVAIRADDGSVQTLAFMLKDAQFDRDAWVAACEAHNA